MVTVIRRLEDFIGQVRYVVKGYQDVLTGFRVWKVPVVPRDESRVMRLVWWAMSCQEYERLAHLRTYRLY
jgi:hypothetical protein